MTRGFNPKTTLGVCWSKRENDWMIYYPCREDGWLIYDDLLKSDIFQNLVKELEKRGYDIQTLRFSIKKKQ